VRTHEEGTDGRRASKKGKKRVLFPKSQQKGTDLNIAGKKLVKA